MALKFVVNGVPVEADSAAEAAELILALGKNGASKPEQPASPYAPIRIARRAPRTKLRFKKKGFDVRSITVAFLSKIAESGKQGTAADGLMEIVGARHPKGIGSKAAAINEYIEKLGFDTSQVYDNPRTAEGRVWKPGPKLYDALKAAQQGG